MNYKDGKYLNRLEIIKLIFTEHIEIELCLLACMRTDIHNLATGMQRGLSSESLIL